MTVEEGEGEQRPSLVAETGTSSAPPPQPGAEATVLVVMQTMVAP